MTVNQNRRKTWIIIMAAAMALLAVCCYFGREYLADSPFARERVFDGPSGVFSGPSGRVYVIDGGKKEVLILNASGELERGIAAGSGGFYYASLVAEGADGSVYVADTLYSGMGTALKAERIFRYDQSGKNPEQVYEISYEGDEDPPLQYGNITSLMERGGELIFARRLDQGARVYRLDLAGGETRETEYALGGLHISDVNVHPDTLLPVFTTRLGQVGMAKASGGFDILVPAEAGRIAWRVCADSESVYYTDLATNQLVRHDIATGAEARAISGGDILYTASITGGRLYSTDYIGYYVSSGGEISYVGAPPLSGVALRFAVWAALLAAALLALALIVLLAIRLFRNNHNATFQRVVIVVLVSLCIGTLVTYIILGQTIEAQNETIMEQLSLFDDILIGNVDTGALRNITQISDYRREDYVKVKGPLDALTRMTYENGVYYYYALYVTDGETIYGVMDYEDTVTARHPCYAFGTEGYTDAFYGETVGNAADVSSYGSWSFVLKPVIDETGGVVAVMEVGVNLDDVNARNRALIVQILLMVVSMAIVLLILIIEWMLYLEHADARRVSGAPGTLRVPVRTLIFLAFLADCMQDAFVSILAKDLYVPFWGIPQSVGAALPLSAQVLSTAMLALLGGALIRRSGIKRVLVAGFIGQIAGFALCVVMGGYFGLLLGKALIGAGMGLIVVSANTAAASLPSQEAGAKAFAAISAGTLAGVTAGSGIGSIVLSLGTYSSVYLVGAGILLLGLGLALSVSGHMEPKRERSEAKAGVMQFLLNRQVITFLLLLLTPFLIALSFREYFFPIYAADMGVSESDIGRVYLACGLMVIYAGPLLTSRLLKKLGGKWTAVLASMLIAAATLLFVLVPGLGAAIIGVVLLSVAISFGYAAQSTYYASLPGVSEFGESRAMGVYSLFDNGGQTLGPLVYGVAMLVGYRAGMAWIGIAIAALALVFIAANAGRKR